MSRRVRSWPCRECALFSSPLHFLNSPSATLRLAPTPIHSYGSSWESSQVRADPSPALRPGAGGLLPLPLTSRLVLYFLDLALYGQLDFLGPSEAYISDVLTLAGWLDSLSCTSLINLLLVSGRAQRWPLAVEFLLGARLRRTDLCREALNRFNDDTPWRDTSWQPPGTISDFATLCPRALPLDMWSAVDRRFMWAWVVADVPDAPPSFGLGDKFLEIYQTP